MRIFLFSFILFSLVEIGLLIWVGTKIGVLSVLGIVILTALIGIYFGRRQGFATWSRAIHSMENQQVPAQELVDGVCIIIGAVLLISPGLLSDVLGLILLFPYTRNRFKKSIANVLRKSVDKGIIVYRRY